MSSDEQAVMEKRVEIGQSFASSGGETNRIGVEVGAGTWKPDSNDSLLII